VETPRPRTHERTHETVLAWIERELGAGRLRLGDRLPGERALAERIGVSRPSVREGLRVLEAMGVLRTAVGSGPESGAAIVADPAAALTSALRLHLGTGHLPLADLVQVRVLLESWAVGRAAAAGDPAAIDRAAALLDAMDDRNLSADDFLELDVEFHLALTEAAGNVLVQAVMTGLRGAIQGYVRDAVPRLPSWDRTAQRLRRQHRAMLAAVREKDAELAARRVTRHIERFYTEAQLDGS
jgi:GntR family transcriptional regulator, transcriptional repressor for pyruvate dehydrogenase complex